MSSKNTHPTSFLSLVAQDLLQRFGNDLSEIMLVFPGVRASLFFNRCLYQEVKSPLWAPQYRSIESLFEGASALQKGDTIQLIAELYESYQEVYNAHNTTPLSETLDEFFFFGEILLNDFDEVDKNLVNPHALFSNLRDLDALRDNFSHLSEEQIEAIRRRLGAFHGDSVLKNAFWNIWSLLGEVYTNFKNRLQAKNLAYPGMLMRSVIENDLTDFPAKHYVFVGFNVLSQCEETLFKQLKHKASFYWDYDKYYLHTEAGRFIQNNIQKLGSALDKSLFDTFLHTDKKITFLASPSESGQSASIEPWIDSLGKEPSFIQADSAIVLCNEALLPAVMHAVSPEKVENVNITMGFPITQTAIYSFLQTLVEMQTKAYRSSDQSFWHRYVLPVLRHPYATLIFPEAKKIENELVRNNIFYPSQEELKHPLLFSYAETTVDLAKYLLDIVQEVGKSYENETENTYTGLYQESIFRSYQLINRLFSLLSTQQLQLGKTTFLHLLRKLFSTVQIPFHGEPVKGLQIMGVLETRNLDFDNLLILNMNEGFMPTGGNNDNTFIPQFLRAHFGMNTIEHQDSIYAYYFYRLIQRAQRITLVYNTDKTQIGKAEMSRFLLQLLVEQRLTGKIERFTLQSSIQPIKPQRITIEKDEILLKKLRQNYDLNTNAEAHRLSPTALNAYINCTYKFYLEYLEGLRKTEDLAEDLDNSVFGSIFHRAAEYIYKEITQNALPFTIQKELLVEYLEYPHKVERIVLQAFEKEYFKNRPVDKSDFNGEQLINFHVVCKLLERMLQFDKARAPFTIIGLEYPVKEEFILENLNLRLYIGGIVDRLEEKDGTRMIFDYKTGGKAKSIKTLEELFEVKNNRAAHIFQTFVYASALLQQAEVQQHPISMALLYIQQAHLENYSPVIQLNKEDIVDFRVWNNEFKSLLLNKISEIFDPAYPFSQTDISENCLYCNFREICNR